MEGQIVLDVKGNFGGEVGKVRVNEEGKVGEVR